MARNHPEGDEAAAGSTLSVSSWSHAGWATVRVVSEPVIQPLDKALLRGESGGQREGGGHADRLAVHPRQPFHRTEPLAPQPQPQHLSNLAHSNLPERLVGV